MGFFDQPQSEPDDVDDADLQSYDDGTAPWLPGLVAEEIVLAQNDRAALVLGSVRVFRETITLKVFAHIRWSEKIAPDEDPFGGRAWHGGRRAGDTPDNFVRFGCAWPDGGKATNLDRDSPGHWPDADRPARRHVLGPDSSGGGGRFYQWSYYLSPIPPEGDLLVVVEWPAYDIGETSVPLDGNGLRHARDQCRPLWDADRDRPDHFSARYRWT
jgi:hypothetical protein